MIKEYQVDTIARVRNCFYIEAESEEEAKNIAEGMIEDEIEKLGLQVQDIEEWDVCEC